MTIKNVVVSGAGTSSANGTYVAESLGEGTYRYNNDVSSIQITASGDGSWKIDDYGEETFLYGSTGDPVNTPDLCTGWEVIDGDLPLPTVTEAADAGGGGGFPILNGSVVR